MLAERVAAVACHAKKLRSELFNFLSTSSARPAATTRLSTERNSALFVVNMEIGKSDKQNLSTIYAKDELFDLKS